MDTESRRLLESDTSSHRWYQCRLSCASLNSYHDAIVVIVACFSAVSMGFILGYSCPAVIDKEFLVILDDDNKISWFSSLIAIGAIIGGPIAAICVEKLGRKMTLLLSNIPLAAGWLAITLAGNLITIYIGRVLTGIAMGIISLSAPLYISEVSTKEHRGMLGACFQLFVTIGILLVYTLGLVLRWSWLATVGIGLAVASTILLPGLPDSPRWLLAKGKDEEARESLQWLSTTTDEETLEAEYTEVEASILRQSFETFSVREILLAGVYKPLIISLGLMFLQQFSGINAIISYSSKIFQSAGFAANPLIPSIIVGGILVLFTIISGVLMDLAGRRILLILSGLFLTLSSAALGTYYLLLEKEGRNLNWLSLSSGGMFVAAFSLGWGPIPWLAMAELFPSRARGMASGIATSFNWLCVFIVTKEFLPVVSAITQYGTFFGFGVINLLGIIFVWFMLPETKGRSLEEIESLFIS